MSARLVQALSEKLEDNHCKGSYEHFSDRRGYLKMQFKSRADPKFTFIRVPEFDQSHQFYIDKYNEMTHVATEIADVAQEEEEKKDEQI